MSWNGKEKHGSRQKRNRPDQSTLPKKRLKKVKTVRDNLAQLGDVNAGMEAFACLLQPRYKWGKNAPTHDFLEADEVAKIQQLISDL